MDQGPPNKVPCSESSCAESRVQENFLHHIPGKWSNTDLRLAVDYETPGLSAVRVHLIYWRYEPTK